MNTYYHIHDAVEAAINEGMTVRDFIFKAYQAWENVCDEKRIEANNEFKKAIDGIDKI